MACTYNHSAGEAGTGDSLGLVGQQSSWISKLLPQKKKKSEVESNWGRHLMSSSSLYMHTLTHIHMKAHKHALHTRTYHTHRHTQEKRWVWKILLQGLFRCRLSSVSAGSEWYWSGERDFTGFWQGWLHFQLLLPSLSHSRRCCNCCLASYQREVLPCLQTDNPQLQIHVLQNPTWTSLPLVSTLTDSSPWSYAALSFFPADSTRVSSSTLALLLCSWRTFSRDLGNCDSHLIWVTLSQSCERDFNFMYCLVLTKSSCIFSPVLW